MCLYTKQICPIKARKRIVVYKVVKRYPHKTGKQKYKTPCMRESIQLYHEYTVDGPIRITKKGNLYARIFYNKNRYRDMYIEMFVIEHGYIHCCTSLDSAKNWLYKNHHLFPRNKKQPFHWGIIRCWIEPGTLYYKNYDGTQIATKKLLTRDMQLKG